MGRSMRRRRDGPVKRKAAKKKEPRKTGECAQEKERVGVPESERYGDCFNCAHWRRELGICAVTRISLKYPIEGCVGKWVLV